MQHFNHWRIPGLLSFCLGSVACVVPIELLETETETGTETQGDSTTHDDAGSGTGTDTSADTGAVGDTDTDTDTDAEPEDRLIALGFSAGGTMEVLSASPVTAATSVLGQMGNLGPWQNQAALSPDDTALYALGFPTDVGINGSLYVFDLSTDTFDYDVAHGGGLDDATLAGFDHQDRLIAMRFSAGGAMEVLSVDPVTAAIGVLGQMGSLGPWQNQAALSPDGTAVYALGFPAEVGINGSLYAFDLSTDTFDHDVAHGGGLDGATLAGFDHQDRLIAMRFSAVGTMEVLSVDPVTAAIGVLGQMGSLGPWQNQAALSPDGTAVYALGFPTDVGIDGSLYVFDLVTDAFDYDVNHGGMLDDATLAGFGQ